VLNFQITMTLLMFAFAFCLVAGLVAMPALLAFAVQEGEALAETGALLALVMPIPMVVTGMYCVFQGVINAVRALSEKPIHYPLSIPFVK